MILFTFRSESSRNIIFNIHNINVFYPKRDTGIAKMFVLLVDDADMLILSHVMREKEREEGGRVRKTDGESGRRMESQEEGDRGRWAVEREAL